MAWESLDGSLIWTFVWSKLRGVFNVYHVWKTSQGAQEIPPDYDDKGVNYHQSQQWKGRVMTCLVHLTVWEVCVKPEAFFRDYFSSIGIKLSDLYYNEWCIKNHLWFSNEDGLWPRSGLWTPLHRVMLPQARSSSGLNILLWGLKSNQLDHNWIKVKPAWSESD